MNTFDTDTMTRGAVTTALDIHGYEHAIDATGRVWVVTEWRQAGVDGTSSDLLPLWAWTPAGMREWLGY